MGVVVRLSPRTIKVLMVGQEEQDIHSGAKKQHSCQPSLLEEASLSINRNESALTKVGEMTAEIVRHPNPDHRKRKRP